MPSAFSLAASSPFASLSSGLLGPPSVVHPWAVHGLGTESLGSRPSGGKRASPDPSGASRGASSPAPPAAAASNAVAASITLVATSSRSLRFTVCVPGGEGGAQSGDAPCAISKAVAAETAAAALAAGVAALEAEVTASSSGAAPDTPDPPLPAPPPEEPAPPQPALAPPLPPEPLKSEAATDGSEATAASSLIRIGSRVRTAYGDVGTVRYRGRPHFKEGEWVGLELDRTKGKNDGEVRGVRYFRWRASPPRPSCPARARRP